MIEQLKGIEKKLDESLVKNAPFQLPDGLKEWIVKYGPYIALVSGIFGLLASLNLWNYAHQANNVINYTNDIYKSYGVSVGANRINVWFYIALVVSIIQSVIAIAAFSGLKARNKLKGWDLMFYSGMLSLVYGIFNAIYYSSFGSLVGGILGSLIGFYFLFQIRSKYNGAKTSKK
ncbi:hypothetical protein KC946_01670 [Candidatus Saccharibacteria bacterium]|nr:hypothetical protein [Candidatus Saccharibacteria bacterium]